MSQSLATEKTSLDRELLILGCGGHSKVVTEIAEAVGFKRISYLDPFYKNKTFLQRKVYKIIEEEYKGSFVVAVADNFIREKIYNQFLKENNSSIPISLIHPTSYVSPRASIEEGSVVMPLCVINSNSQIGKGVIINTSSSVDHDCSVMDFSSVAPGVNIGGSVKIGIRSIISISATISHGISIGNDVLVGGASLVLKSVQNNSVVYGVPASYVRNRKAGEIYL